MARTSRSRDIILAFIKTFRDEHGYAPTVREIAHHCGLKSTSVVQHHLNHLQKAGLITKTRERFRSIAIAGERTGTAMVPLIGTIAAGHPIWVPSVDASGMDAEKTIEVPSGILRGKRDVFALEVRGNSMVDAMIADSDVVLMEKVTDVTNGDVVACWLRNEQEVTLKRIYFENGTVRLQPCNPYMMPVYHKKENVEIQGRVIAVVRILR
jgi:repressor LexA